MRIDMKYIAMLITTRVSLLMGIFLLASCGNSDTTLTISNDSDSDRVDEPVVIQRTELEVPDDSMLPVVLADDGQPVPSQVDDINLDGEWDELAFLIDVQAQESRTLQVEFVDSDEYPEFEQRTNIRFGVKQNGSVEHVEELSIAADELPVPPFGRFQMDGPAWENDKVGFRQYIDGRNAIDLYGKRTSEMALDPVGLSEEGEIEDNYHEMLDWGRDILAVGNSLGIGGIAVLHNNQPVRLGITLDDDRGNVEQTHYKEINNGPVRSLFKITYEGWQVEDQSYDVENTVTIWGGKYWHINDVVVNSPEPSDTLIVGLVNIFNDRPPELLEDNQNWTSLVTHDEQTYDKDYILGMALIVPQQNFLEYTEAPEEGSGIINSFNIHLSASDGNPVRYYAVAGWELSEEEFADRDNFTEYVRNEIRAISNPVSVTIN